MLAFNHLGTLGRLGNQMFQYASLRGIAAKKGYDFGIPPSNFQDEWRNHQLFQVFELSNLPQQNVRFLDNGHAPIVQEKKFGYDKELHELCPNDISLWGFFQSEKYFYHIGASIREDFKFRDHVLKPCIEMAESLDDAVSLHVRRTDYLQNSGNHFNLQLDYYEKALSKIDPDRTVVVFSDDPEWCENHEAFSEDRFAISNNAADFDLCLMTLCKYHIIANSSYSWWGSWLGNSDKIIAPKNWFGATCTNKSVDDMSFGDWDWL